ncbi:Hypothetical predicted protein [Marmota monax]|uniref:Uncharacterized protein n=1 Tax=Marmota monax TaxID=9995 RepID=A0A5E4C9P9_MARMO|nr:hypothetical protein GHT09_016494 [Marmota monax]VTJ77919.1 Hypothetical predicted protein [Marmota monax]
MASKLDTDTASEEEAGNEPELATVKPSTTSDHPGDRSRASLTTTRKWYNLFRGCQARGGKLFPRSRISEAANAAAVIDAAATAANREKQPRHSGRKSRFRPTLPTSCAQRRVGSLQLQTWPCSARAPREAPLCSAGLSAPLASCLRSSAARSPAGKALGRPHLWFP